MVDPSTVHAHGMPYTSQIPLVVRSRTPANSGQVATRLQDFESQITSQRLGQLEVRGYCVFRDKGLSGLGILVRKLRDVLIPDVCGADVVYIRDEDSIHVWCY